MRLHWQWLKRLIREDGGPTSVEYAVVLALILLIALGAIRTFGSATSKSIRNSAQSIGS